MALFLVIISFSLKKFRGFNFIALSNRDWLLIVVVGIFGALSWLFYFFALKNGPVMPAVAIDRLSLVFVLVLALMFLGESFSLKAVVGGVINGERCNFDFY